jgi:predicted Zn-dependent peptidase
MRSFVTLSLALLTGCGAAAAPSLAPRPRPDSGAVAAARKAPDAIGERPAVTAPTPFAPAMPMVLPGPGGSKIWLVERHSQPLVSLAVVSSIGAAADPRWKVGLSAITARMLAEGAGRRDALAFSAALEELGTSLETSAERDSSVVRLDVATSRLPDALGLVADALVRPRHAERDFARASSLWKIDLASRADDADAVARAVAAAALLGPDHPYGRPLEGTRETAARVTLDDVRWWHHAVWRPDQTTFVVVGDVTPAAAHDLLARAFAGFRNPDDPAPAVVMPKKVAKAPRAVIVDRPDAPEVVMAFVGRGVLVSSEALPALTVLNVALGDALTSRLGQSLREDHGLTSSARSTLVAEREAGLFVAQAAIRTDAIEPALKDVQSVLGTLVREGLSAEETTKAKGLRRTAAIDAHGSLGGIARTLARNAALGLAPDHDARALRVVAAVTKDQLGVLAEKHLALGAAVIVLVGPRKAAEAALEASGIHDAELRDENGRPVGKALK